MKANASHKFLIGASILILVLASACRKKDILNFNGPAHPHILTEKMEKEILDFQWMSAKVSAETNIDGEKTSFKINLRMRRDSAIWMSISPALGIEVARIVVSPDSVKFIDKWNDRFYVGDHRLIEERIGMELDFATLQDLAIGNPILYNPEEKFKGSKDDNGYILTSKAKGRVRRLAGVRHTRRNVEAMEDSIQLDVNERRYDRVIDRIEEEDQLILKRYWIHPESYKVLRTIISDLINLRSLEVDYTAFENMDQGLVPVKMKYVINQGESKSSFEMEYSRLRIDRPTSFPFKVPEKFERIES